MRVVVCGAGQVGSTIARHLASEGIEVTVVDISEEQVRRVDESYDVRGIVGHGSYPKILEKAGARDADMLIAVTRSDEVNMVACQVAYSLFRVKRRVARLRHVGYIASTERGLYAAEHLPIDVIISPEIEIADGICRRLKAPGAFDMVPMADGLVQLLGIHCDTTGCGLIGVPCGEIGRRPSDPRMNVVALVRNGRAFLPAPDEELQVGDDVYVIAATSEVDNVVGAFGHKESAARRVLLVGGGNVGLHLARKLVQESPGLTLKIIELNRERAAYCAAELGSKAVVLHGDALDRHILEEAQFASAETIIAVTNDDETNIFASVLAKQAGCARAITLVNKRNYESLMPTLGIDAVVSPSAITISTILRQVRRSEISALYNLREDFGEVVETELQEDSAMVGSPLTGLNLPSGMRVGAVVRGSQVLVDGEADVLQPGDRIIALITYHSLKKAEAVLTARKRPR